MANPKEPKPKEPKPKEPKPKERKKKEEKGVLEATAETIGSALGAIAAKVGVDQPEVREKRVALPKIGKLPKKNKQRMPRKLKKRALKERGSA